MTDFAKRFHLLKPSRGFEVAPWDPDDAEIYFGDRKLDLQLQKRIQAGYALGRPPKIYLQGRWGAGKTHHLYHLKHVLESGKFGSSAQFVAPYLQIECEDDTDFRYLHKKMLNALGLETVKRAVGDFLMSHSGADRADAQHRVFGSTNLTIATQVLSIGDDQLAWKWMSGERLSSNELRSLNVTTNLEDTSDLVDVLVRVGRLLKEEGTSVLFFVDEAEGLKNVTRPNAQSSWHDGIKNLADNMNDAIGYVFGIFVDSNNPSPDFVNEDDILRRMGQQNVVTLDHYSEATEIVPFLLDLVASRIDLKAAGHTSTPDSYPFTPDAMDLFVNELLSGAVPATPSKIIEGLSECAWEAHVRDEDEIELDVVQEVMPRVTAAV